MLNMKQNSKYVYDYSHIYIWEKFGAKIFSSIFNTILEIAFSCESPELIFVYIPKKEKERQIKEVSAFKLDLNLHECQYCCRWTAANFSLQRNPKRKTFQRESNEKHKLNKN